MHEAGGRVLCVSEYSAFLGKGGVRTATELATRLLHEAHVVTVPGEAFGTAEHIRISYPVTKQNIDEGTRRMGEYPRPPGVVPWSFDSVANFRMRFVQRIRGHASRLPCPDRDVKKYRPSLCKPSFCRVGCVFHAEVYRFSSSYSCRWQRNPILAPLPPRPGQASAGARWRALHDSADGGAAEAAGRAGKDVGNHQ